MRLISGFGFAPECRMPYASAASIPFAADSAAPHPCFTTAGIANLAKHNATFVAGFVPIDAVFYYKILSLLLC